MARPGRRRTDRHRDRPPDGRDSTRAYRYDDAGQLTSASIEGDETRWAYDASGNRTSVTKGPESWTSSHDLADQAISTEHRAGGVMVGRELYAHDGAGRLFAKREQGAAGQQTRAEILAHDARGRLAVHLTRAATGGADAAVGALYTDWSTQRLHDPEGRLVSMATAPALWWFKTGPTPGSVPAVPLTSAIDWGTWWGGSPPSEINSIPHPLVVSECGTHGHDQLIWQTGFCWNSSDPIGEQMPLPLPVPVPGTPPIQLIVPPLGTPAIPLPTVPGQQPVPIRVSQLYWDPTTPVPEVATVSGETETDLLYGHGRIAAVRGTDFATFARDAYGSSLVTPENDDLVMGSSYDAWGVPSVDTTLSARRDISAGGLDASEHMPLFGYRGELHQDEMVHLRAREYEPAVGRFTTTDAVDGRPGQAASANRYPYAASAPLDNVDPLGLKPSRFPASCVERDYQAGRIPDFMTWVLSPTCTFVRWAGYTPDVLRHNKAGNSVVVEQAWHSDGCSDHGGLPDDVRRAFDESCRSHDYGFDLLRFAATLDRFNMSDRRAADNQFYAFLGNLCGNTGYYGRFNKQRCYRWREAAYDYVQTGTQLAGGPPSGRP